MKTSRIINTAFFSLILYCFTPPPLAHTTPLFSKISKQAILLNPPTVILSNQPRKTLQDPFITIDPVHSLELDDALYVEPYTEGSCHCKIAIADPVSILIKGNPEILKNGLEQVFTRYDEHPIRPLYPIPLAEMSSLTPGQPRPTIVVDFKIDPNGEILSAPLVYQATITSVYRFSYDEVNKYIQDQEPLPLRQGNKLIDPILNASLALRYKRLGTNKGKITSEEAVAEMMLEANFIVATLLKEQNLHGPYRSQTAPHKRAFYSNLPIPHASLGGRIYTHFTSPLRRFADCLVHANLFYPELFSLLGLRQKINDNKIDMMAHVCQIMNEAEKHMKKKTEKHKK